jgi:hypothetical protein
MSRSPAPGEGKSLAGLLAVLAGGLVVATAAGVAAYFYFQRAGLAPSSRMTAPMPKLVTEEDEREEKAKKPAEKARLLPMPKPVEGE